MTEWLSSIGPAVGNHLWQSTAFAAAAWVVTLLLRRNHAHVRYAIWLAASLKFLLPFSLLIALGGLLPRPQHTVVAAPVSYAMDTVALPFSDAPIESAPVAPHISRSQQFMHALPMLLAGLWLCGAIVALTIWAGGWLQVKKALRRAIRVEDGREAAILRRIEDAAHACRNIPLLLSGELMEPGIFGIFRPVLIWPERLSERLDDEHIEAIMVHELAHARRRDNLTAAIHMLVEAAFWFHPLVWWMERRMVEERERACDEAVVATGSRPGIYAESLLKACRFCVESPLVCVSGITGADLSKRVLSIMTLRLERLGWHKKAALAAFGLAAIAAPVMFGVVRMIPMYGQILHPTGPLPSFEVATIRPMEQMPFAAPPGGAAPSGSGRVAPNGEPIVSQQEVHISPAPRFSDHVNNVMTAKMLIDYAYNLPAFSESQIVGGPDWTGQTMYRIDAKIDDSQFVAMQKMPQAQQVQQVQLMEQSLLADRFKLKVHFETRQMPVYALEVARGGPKLTPAETEPAAAGVPAGIAQAHPTSLVVTGKEDRFVILAKGAQPGQLIVLLQQQPELGNRMVVDKTGLAGKYDMTLDWTREGSAEADAGAAKTDAAPPFFTALKVQLGLQLVETKGPVEVLVIDHVEKPSVDGAEVLKADPTGDGKAVTNGAPGAEVQAIEPAGLKAVAQVLGQQPPVWHGIAWSTIPQPDAPAELCCGGAGPDDSFGVRVNSKSDKAIFFFRLGWVYVHPGELEFDKGETIVPYNGMPPHATFGAPDQHVSRDGARILVFLEEVRFADGATWHADHKQIEAYYKAHPIWQAVPGDPPQQRSDIAPARPVFEVASVKPAAPGRALPPMLREVIRGNGRPGEIAMTGPDRVRFQNSTLLDLIATAYSVRVAQVSGPAWLSDQGFDIEAKVPEGTPKEELNVMLRSLLEERFGLKVHRGTQTGPGFALVVGKDGPKMKPAAPPPAPVEGLTDEERKAKLQQMQAGLASQQKRMDEQLAAVGPFNNVGWGSISMEVLAAQLVRLAGAPVIDETGLAGEYKVTLDTWSNPDIPGGTIFDAVEKLGLKLEPRKVTVETVVVDQVSKTPSAD